MSDHYFTVGEHGPPTPETCPHGYAYRVQGETEWIVTARPRWVVNFTSRGEWYPLPAPPTEKAPAPEKWAALDVDSFNDKWGIAIRAERGLMSGSMPLSVAEAAVARLNWEPDWEGFERWVAESWDRRPYPETIVIHARKYLSPPEVP